MAYLIAAIVVFLSVLEGHSSIASVIVLHLGFYFSIYFYCYMYICANE